MRIGLYFGSFNPVHVGHIEVARAVLTKFTLDEVWLIVSPQNPFKDALGLASEKDRFAMALIACKDDPQIRASDFEFSMPRPSFTVSTVQKLLVEHPDNTFFLIIGEDNLQFFHQWKDVRGLLDLVEVIVYPRSSEALALPAELLEYKHRFHRLPCGLIPISATNIRQQIKNGGRPHSMLNPGVWQYIEQHHLYS